MAHVASDLYGTSLLHFLDEMGGAKDYKVDHDNDAVRPALVLELGEKRWPPPPKKKVEVKEAPKPAPVVPKPAEHEPKLSHPGHIKPGHMPAAQVGTGRLGMVMSMIGLCAAAAFVGLRLGYADHAASPEAISLLQHLTVFVMAIFVGFQVVWNVTPALHTPLMSVTNAISGIIVVGGLLNARSHGALPIAVIVAVVATLFATINIAGGFLVTRRMLAMFRK